MTSSDVTAAARARARLFSTLVRRTVSAEKSAVCVLTINGFWCIDIETFDGLLCMIYEFTTRAVHHNRVRYLVHDACSACLID